jgi:hypothetical protein
MYLNLWITAKDSLRGLDHSYIWMHCFKGYRALNRISMTHKILAIDSPCRHGYSGRNCTQHLGILSFRYFTVWPPLLSRCFHSMSMYLKVSTFYVWMIICTTRLIAVCPLLILEIAFLFSSSRLAPLHQRLLQPSHCHTYRYQVTGNTRFIKNVNGTVIRRTESINLLWIHQI